MTDDRARLASHRKLSASSDSVISLEIPRHPAVYPLVVAQPPVVIEREFQEDLYEDTICEPSKEIVVTEEVTETRTQDSNNAQVVHKSDIREYVVSHVGKHQSGDELLPAVQHVVTKGNYGIRLKSTKNDADGDGDHVQCNMRSNVQFNLQFDTIQYVVS